ncbi:MarR family winged helix-turn-helix transcriptional regulator [Gordonia sp. NPDC003950]
MSSVPSVEPMLPFLLMQAESGVNERINRRVVEAGHHGLRPVHGLVFARIAGGGASINDIARHLGMTKQSAAAIVEALESNGYVVRTAHPSDRRARLIELTDRGESVMRLAGAAAAAEISALTAVIGEAATRVVVDALRILGEGASPRPSW